MTKEYILFCFQEANFQTRTLLVPKVEFESAPERLTQLQSLRKHSFRNVPILSFQGGDEQHPVGNVDHLLLQNYTSQEGGAMMDASQVGEILEQLLAYADGWEGRSNFLESDFLWLPKSWQGLTTGFDHLANYLNLRYQTSETPNGQKMCVSESFLVLETQDGKSPLFREDIFRQRCSLSPIEFEKRE